MPDVDTNDFAKLIEDAQREGSVAHPFGAPSPPRARGRTRGLNVRQTTKMFFCPKDLEDYDEVCNRAWAGEIELRYERNYNTKEGDHVIVLCWFDSRPTKRPDEVEAEGDQEPLERSRKMP